MIVVADASPLIALERIGQLDLLAALFNQVVVPRAVFTELVHRSPGPGALAPQWLQVQDVRDKEAVNRLSVSLHAGEAEAIILAVELGVPLLMDEKAGRRAARTLGVEVTGTVAVLLAAKRAGAIERVNPVLGQLAATGFHLSRTLIERARRVAGEA